MIRVLVVDDHAIVREGLKQIMSGTQDIMVADEAADSQEAVDKVLAKDYDIVVLDITLPGRGGLDVLKEIKSQKPELPVLILSMHPEAQYAVRTLKAGASGYLTKDSAPTDLITAIRKIAEGGKYVTPSLAEKLASELTVNHGRPFHEVLSQREYEVMCMIATGKTVGEIASEMALSPKTISTYRCRILEKMNMKNNPEIMAYAIRNGLV